MVSNYIDQVGFVVHILSLTAEEIFKEKEEFKPARFELWHEVCDRATYLLIEYLGDNPNLKHAKKQITLKIKQREKLEDLIRLKISSSDEYRDTLLLILEAFPRSFHQRIWRKVRKLPSEKDSRQFCSIAATIKYFLRQLICEKFKRTHCILAGAISAKGENNSDDWPMLLKDITNFLEKLERAIILSPNLQRQMCKLADSTMKALEKRAKELNQEQMIDHSDAAFDQGFNEPLNVYLLGRSLITDCNTLIEAMHASNQR